METVLSSTSIDELNEMLRNLVGILCWQIRVSMYDSLKLDFGQRTDFPIRWKSEETTLAVGEWVLDSWGTAFELRHQHTVVTTSQEDWTKNLGSLRALEGSHLTAIRPSRNFELSLEFANEYILAVLPTPADVLEDLPFWEFYYRGDDKVIEVGPDVWSCRPYADRRFQ